MILKIRPLGYTWNQTPIGYSCYTKLENHKNTTTIYVPLDLFSSSGYLSKVLNVVKIYKMLFALKFFFFLI